MPLDPKKIESLRRLAAKVTPLTGEETVEARIGLHALLFEREEREERMRVILHAGPSTAVATIVYDRAIRAEERLAEALSLLREVEWVEAWNGDRHMKWCPACKRSAYDFVPDEQLPMIQRGRERSPHAPGCRLDALLNGGGR